MRDHGGDLDRARALYGGGADAPWIDLSTGINPIPYPVPALPDRAWAALPPATDLRALEDAAGAAFGARRRPVALAGASAAIQLVPRLAPRGRARVLGPTYNEHAAALRAEGWQVEEVTDPDALAGADLAVVVNPNNPDGRRHRPGDLLALASRVGLLAVDESFADVDPALSVLPHLDPGAEGVVVLRSFGKFYGLAGLRLGFAVAGPKAEGRLRAMAGPWAASGPAAAIGRAAYADAAWAGATRARLAADAARLDALAEGAGWELVGGCPLFRTYRTADAAAAQAHLARAGIWTRIFPYSQSWMRLGLPGADGEWDRLAAAFAALPG